MVGSQGGRAWSLPLLLPRQTKLPWMQSCKHTDWDTVPTYAASSTSIPQLPMRKQKTIKECFSFIKLVGSESISESYREVSEEKCYRGGWRRRRSERLAEDLQAPMNWVTDGRWARGRGWLWDYQRGDGSAAVPGVYKQPVWPCPIGPGEPGPRPRQSSRTSTLLSWAPPLKNLVWPLILVPYTGKSGCVYMEGKWDAKSHIGHCSIL